MRFHRHVLRDVVFLTLPVAVLLVYVTVASAINFYNAEIANFHGYLVRGLRVGGFQAALRIAVEPVVEPGPRRFISDWSTDLETRPLAPTPSHLQLPGWSDPSIRTFDLRVSGLELDKLTSDIPGSGKEWADGELVDVEMNATGVSRRVVPVDVRFRGQRISNYFWDQKAWKIRTGKTDLIDGYRVINLTPAGPRLEGHLTFLVARQIGLPAPRSRVVQLYVNHEFQGLYLQEEQIDESMIRRLGRMPGDVFYGELFVPEEPKMSADDLFWNPFLWIKKEQHNAFDEEYRPHLTELLDRIDDDDPGSFDRLYELLDLEVLARHFAILAFHGDQHTDHSHNHKLYFDPLGGKFDVILWNNKMNMPRGAGPEPITNRFYRKLCRDPRFLDRVHRVLYEELVESDKRQVELGELERIRRDFAPLALDRAAFERAIDRTASNTSSRGQRVSQMLAVGDVRFEDRESSSGRALSLWTRSLASLRLESVVLGGSARGITVYEDRDRDGVVGAGDRALKTDPRGNQLVILDPAAMLYPGRDFSAPYYQTAEAGRATFQAHRLYTRLAFLESRYLLTASGGAAVPEVESLTATRSVGIGSVQVQRGAPDADDFIATDSVHPWSMPDPEAPRRFAFTGEVNLREDLVVRDVDSFTAAPGTILRLAPGVSVVLHSKVHLQRLNVERLNSDYPWGVFALQGAAASGSVLENCEFRGGSEAVVDHIYYSGMVSAHRVSDLVVRGGVYENNVLGDDTLRLGRCDNLRIEGVQVLSANSDAIDCDLSTGVITGAFIADSRNDGIDLMTAQVDIRDTTIQRAGDKGISFGESANPTVSGCVIENCVLGIGLKDASDPLLVGVSIRGCRTGIAGYDKNWRYPGGGRGVLVQCRLKDNVTDFHLDASSGFMVIGAEAEQEFHEQAAADPRVRIFESMEAAKQQLPADEFEALEARLATSELDG